MKAKWWILIGLMAVLGLIVFRVVILPDHVNESSTKPQYENQTATVTVGVEVAPADTGLIEAEEAPEVPVYDPSAVDEGMGEEGISPEDEANIPPGWTCDGPAYLCRGEEAEKDREREQQKWLDEQEQAKEEAEAEENAPWTCEGSGSYGDYSPEGYEGALDDDS